MKIIIKIFILCITYVNHHHDHLSQSSSSRPPISIITYLNYHHHYYQVRAMLTDMGFGVSRTAAAIEAGVGTLSGNDYDDDR